jgi:hypothetical protein
MAIDQLFDKGQYTGVKKVKHNVQCYKHSEDAITKNPFKRDLLIYTILFKIIIVKLF